MLELLQEVRDAIDFTVCIEGGEELDRVYDKVCQAIEDLKSISEPIGAKIENVEVME